MNYSQNYAISIELALRNIFDCERYGFGGIINSDFIRKNPFAAMLSGLAYIYASASIAKQVEIENFIENHSLYSEMSIDMFLHFESNKKSVDGVTLTLDFKDDEAVLKDMIEKFKVVTTIN